MPSTTTRALGVCYYPEHWSIDLWQQDAERMISSGITHVRIGEFAWSRIQPSPDTFDFDWLDQALDILTKSGLKIIFSTPTATPPSWLVSQMPDMIALDINGNPRTFGSRRHYCFSHQGYRSACTKIVEVLGERYGTHSGIIAWQLDNEYGCHNTTLSFSPSAKSGFQDWLSQRYQSPDALNRSWGNVFWSMEISDFSQIELPNLTATDANPSHWLDYYRYSSDQVVSFNRLQVDILRRLAPDHLLLHNFMGKTLDFDHYQVCQDLDIVSWDSYPLGFLERFGTESSKSHYSTSGDPDFQAFHHDLYRGCGERLWIMEQQPGPVNWAPWNPAPRDGMVRLWTHEAFAHGADLVSYFRWRQSPFAQEQMHTGLLRPDSTEDKGLEEARQVSKELELLPTTTAEKSKILFLFDYPSQWATMIQPQGEDYDGFTLTLDFYRALRMLGQSIDITSPSHIDKKLLDEYKLVVIPHLIFLNKDLCRTFSQTKTKIIFGPRCGSRTSDHHIPPNLPPDNLQDIFPFRVTRVESLRPTTKLKMKKTKGHCIRWFEHLQLDKCINISFTTTDGHPVLIEHKNLNYLGGWADEELFLSIFSHLLSTLDLPYKKLEEGIRIRDNGNIRTILNYGNESRDISSLIPKGYKILFGSKKLESSGVLVLVR